MPKLYHLATLARSAWELKSDREFWKGVLVLGLIKASGAGKTMYDSIEEIGSKTLTEFGELYLSHLASLDLGTFGDQALYGGAIVGGGVLVKDYVFPMTKAVVASMKTGLSGAKKAHNDRVKTKMGNLEDKGSKLNAEANKIQNSMGKLEKQMV